MQKNTTKQRTREKQAKHKEAQGELNQERMSE
jgi:hypothetical protein